MNIELEEVVHDVSDDALEMAAGGAQGGATICTVNGMVSLYLLGVIQFLGFNARGVTGISRSTLGVSYC